MSIKSKIVRLLSVILITAVSTILSGCQSDTPEVSQLKDEVHKLVERTSDALNQLAPKKDALVGKANDEVDKLFAFEYIVHDLPIKASSDELSTTLNDLGKERWECFSVVDNIDGKQLLCKRRPQSYLRYVPRVIP